MIGTRSNDEYGDGSHRKAHNLLNDFITQRHDKSLSPLRLAHISIPEFSTELTNYLSVLNGGGSIAFGRGEDLTSIRLSKSLESLFSNATPCVREGPPLTWTTIILFAGPHFAGPSQLTVGESSIDLSEEDLKLLRSGRPWRFLSPWPDKDDCKKELQSSEIALQELIDTRKMMDEVLEKVSLVEQHLKNHHEIVAQLCEDQYHDSDQGEHLGFGVARGPAPDQGVLVAGASDERAVHRGSPSALANIRHSSIVRTAQPNTENPNDPGLSGDATSRNDMQRDSPRSGNNASQGLKLHISDFIQTLSEILDDPKNEEAMRWSEDGQSIFIALESKFPVHLLTSLSTKSYQSFVRRLYYYGFHKFGGAYRHESFIRGQPSAIRPTREMSHSPSLPSSLRNSTSQHGPRYKVIKRKRTRESV